MIAMDCGIKINIISYLVNVLQVELTVFPWNYDVTNGEFDGLFLSNGPGNPNQCEKTIGHVRIVRRRSRARPSEGTSHR